MKIIRISTVLIFTYILYSSFINIGCKCSEQKEIQILLPDSVLLDMVYIPPGSFRMGSDSTEIGHEPDEKPVHMVTLAYDFYMGKTEITQSQWISLMENWPDAVNQPHAEEGLGDLYPAYYVSWNDCQNFVSRLNDYVKSTSNLSLIFRLPSEAEWEYACRAGTKTRFYFGDSLNLPDGKVAGDYMWYQGNNQPVGTKPVANKISNSWGLFDMQGNVWEWCQDWYHPNYDGAPVDGSVWDDPPGMYRILHGGDWDNKANSCRCANRNDHRKPTDRSADLGFRIVAVMNK